MAFADADAGCRPLANAVHRHHHGVRERRWIERAGGMALMMLREQQARFHVLAAEVLERLAQQALLKQFLLDPNGHRGLERAKAVGRRTQIGFQ